MMLKSKFTAFTVMELLVVLVISSVVMSLSVYVYTNIQKMVVTKFKKGNYYQEIMNKLNKFEDDFKNASLVKISDENIIMKNYNTAKVTYQLESYFSNLYNNKDSISICNLDYSYIDSSDVIYKITFNITGYQKDTLVIKFYKNYSPYFFVNQLSK